MRARVTSAPQLFPARARRTSIAAHVAESSCKVWTTCAAIMISLTFKLLQIQMILRPRGEGLGEQQEGGEGARARHPRRA